MLIILLFIGFVQSYTELQLPPLAYPYNALEPVLSERLMQLHHQKHHRAYTDKANVALKEMAHDENPMIRTIADQPIEKILTDFDRIPEKYRLTLRQHGGGFLNHKLFFSMLRSPTTEENRAEGGLFTAIEKTFQSWEKFREVFTSKAMSVFGSGWVWLYVDGPNGQLVINSTANQDNPWVTENVSLIQYSVPSFRIMFDATHRVILGIDLWEHGTNKQRMWHDLALLCLSSF